MTSKNNISAILNGVLLLSILFLSSCNNRNIEKLTNEKVKFNDLPLEIKEYLKNPTDMQSEIHSMLLELPKRKEPNYRLQTVNTWIGPWVNHEKLINIHKDISYEIDQGVPSPYIVYQDKLYIPDRYNIFTTVDDLSTLVFTRYDLK
jgi:hypothetical protein